MEWLPLLVTAAPRPFDRRPAHVCGAAVRNERRGRDPVFSLSYAEMHRDKKWWIHIPDSIADTSLLQAAMTLTICGLSAL